MASESVSVAGLLERMVACQKTFQEARTHPKPFDVEVGMRPVKDLTDLLHQVNAAFPGLLPAFSAQDYLVFRSLKGQPRYDNEKIQGYIQECVRLLREKSGASG